jgi:hypothetical protein
MNDGDRQEDEGQTDLPVLTVAADTPPKAARFAQHQDERIGPVPPERPSLSLQRVIEALHDSEINVGMQSFCFSGLQVWIGDELNGIKARGRLERGHNGQWLGDGAVGLWLHRTALRLYPDSDYARRYGRRVDELTVTDAI